MYVYVLVCCCHWFIVLLKLTTLIFSLLGGVHPDEASLSDRYCPSLLQPVMSICQVSAGLFLSGLDSALNLSVLTSRNITLIVNATGLEDVSYPPLDGLQVLHVPVQDQPHAPLNQYFDPVAQRINQNQTGRTLVHCTAGRSRSPALVMAYLMRLISSSHLKHLLCGLDVRCEISSLCGGSCLFVKLRL